MDANDNGVLDHTENVSPVGQTDDQGNRNVLLTVEQVHHGVEAKGDIDLALSRGRDHRTV